jgi:hypothetical protein
MESVLAAFVIILILLFGGLTLSQSFMAAQDDIYVATREMEIRLGDRARTDLSPVEAEMDDDYEVLDATLRNEGDTRLSDFDRWDVIVQYTDEDGDYHVEWLDYTTDKTPDEGKWAVVGLYADADEGIKEGFERGILNGGEEIIIRLRLDDELGEETVNRVAISGVNGIGTQVIYYGPPEEEDGG